MNFFVTCFLLISWLAGSEPISRQIGKGIHPAVATDAAGGVHVVFGRGSLIFYTASRDGETFSMPVRVDSVVGLHLGASRGPQIAATAQSVVITAIDKPGNVWAYVLNRKSGQWQPRVRITDVPDIAKEGFVSLTASPDNVYNAVWLDLRNDKHNKIVGARSTDGGHTWLPNRVLYQSPDGTVCECCQLSVVSQGKRVAVMFRNFLNGARDMYLLKSEDGGQTFGKAEKIGKGTWKLNACPMDGGGLYMTPNGTVSTVWRRENKVYTARPGQPETELGEGKNAKIVLTEKGEYVVFQQAGQLMITTPEQTQPKAMATGAYPKLTVLPNGRVLCLWEQDGTVWARPI
ncbi:sialidase family protein [Spirosoma sp. KNUC1025]|uniref:sialidase family protein n=1 Tax=Spirosoma sp. KNUC1025 TaxID=2894082 RepID=UPI00386422FE|nr:glycoside hydrolase [Spirosoma sp. KNUC1025]